MDLKPCHIKAAGRQRGKYLQKMMILPLIAKSIRAYHMRSHFHGSGKDVAHVNTLKSSRKVYELNKLKCEDGETEEVLSVMF